jgi:hypothetical protein
MADARDDIERYLRGDMTPEEMHKLERKAMHDPFLADALEGASSISAEAFDADMQSLRGKLPQRQARVVPLWVTISRIAAGLLLLAVVGYFIVRPQPVPEKLALN